MQQTIGSSTIHNSSAGLGRPKLIVLIVWAILLSLLTGFFSHRIEHTYLQHFPRFFDPCAYDLQNIQLFHLMQKNGALTMAWKELLYDERDPLRTIPLLLFCPNMLAKDYAHLLTAVPLLFSFVFTLSLLVWRRARSLSLTLAVPALFCAVPVLYSPINGLGPNWLDLPVAMSAGAAILCLLEFLESHRLKWLWWFGVLSSITVLSRWTTAYYLGFYAGPLLIWSLIAFYKKYKSVKQPLTAVAVSCAPALFFGLWYSPKNLTHYKVFDYGLDSPISECFTNLGEVAVASLGVPLLVVFISLILVNTVSVIREKSAAIRTQFVAGVLYFISLVIFLCLGVRIAHETHSVLYILPAMFIAVFYSCRNILYNATTQMKKLIVGSLTLAAAIALGINSFATNYKIAVTPTDAELRQRITDSQFARVLADHKLASYAEFDDERLMASADTFYNFGWFIAIPEVLSFSIHEAYYHGCYPGFDPNQVALMVYQHCGRWVDAVMIHRSLADIKKSTHMDNLYSRRVSTIMTERIPSNPGWKKIASIDSLNGPLDVYENVHKRRR